MLFCLSNKLNNFFLKKEYTWYDSMDENSQKKAAVLQIRNYEGMGDDSGVNNGRRDKGAA